MAIPYHIIEFPLKKNLETQEITFVPYGTRTLKIRMTNPDGLTERFVLRTENIPPKFGKTEFFSHEEGGTDFQISWGGGHEKGSCVSGQDRIKNIAGKEIKIPFEECGPLLNRDFSFVYINMTHLKGPFATHRTLLLSVRPEDAPESEPMFTLPLIIKPPDVSNPTRLVETGKNAYEFQGTDIPEYLNRWWAPKDVSYTSGNPPPPKIKIETSKETLKISQVDNDQPYPLVEYHDAVKFQDLGEGHKFDLDLYHFIAHYYVVRLWFFWLWKEKTKTWGHEIPDAERFDFVIDTHKKKVVYVATDTHWRESWAPGPEDGSPVIARIGLFAPDVIEKMTRNDQKNHEAYVDWMLKHKFGEDEDEEPVIPAEAVLAKLDPAGFPGVLGVGLEAHVPYFINCPPPEGERFIGSDPRYR